MFKYKKAYLLIIFFSTSFAVVSFSQKTEWGSSYFSENYLFNYKTNIKPDTNKNYYTLPKNIIYLEFLGSTHMGLKTKCT